MNKKLLTVSPSPHVKADLSTDKIMQYVIWAMIPALLVSLLFFGLGAFIVTLIAVLSCVIFEFLIQKYMLKEEPSIKDGSAIVTGMLLAFNVPSNLPVWMVIVGSLVAIGIGKMTFGGLGRNPFNPALVGRVFLLISFPVEMTTWPKPQFLNFTSLDGATGATALGIVKEGLKLGHPLTDLMNQAPSHLNIFLGQCGGSLGEVSGIAILLGGLYLIWKRIITWHIPFSYLVTVFLMTGAFWLYDSSAYADPFFHLFAGGLMLGAFFMATDMVTSPMSTRGMIIFGIGCGILTTVIRLFGAYPEGVSFAILIMNAFAPLINISFKPKKFGVQ